MPLEELTQDARELKAETTLAPRKEKGWVLELKVPMKAGQSLRYEYEADGELTFNIHAHHGKEVTHHVHIDSTRGNGVFTSSEDYDYYPMWENSLDHPVKLRYRLSRE